MTKEELKKVLDYEPRTGIFRWRINASTRRDAGSVAGCLDPRGYEVISIVGRKYYAHRLAWIYVYGSFPENQTQIDHINGVLNDNRLSNLRPASNGQNRANSKNQRIGRLKGTYQYYRRWRARVRINGRLRNLGSFQTEQEAHDAYCVAAKCSFGEYHRP